MQIPLQRMSEKHPDFKIQAVNIIRTPDIKYTKTSQPLVPVDTPLSVIKKHIPRQSDIDKIVKSLETQVIHGLELLIQAQDLVKAPMWLLSLNPFIEFRIWNNSSSSDVLYIQASISISPKYKSK